MTYGWPNPWPKAIRSWHVYSAPGYCSKRIWKFIIYQYHLDWLIFLFISKLMSMSFHSRGWSLPALYLHLVPILAYSGSVPVRMCTDVEQFLHTCTGPAPDRSWHVILYRGYAGVCVNSQCSSLPEYLRNVFDECGFNILWPCI